MNTSSNWTSVAQ